MRKVACVLRWLASAWMVGVLVLIILAITGAFLKRGFLGGIAQVQEWFSPFNLANYLVLVALVSPAILLLTAADRLSR